MWVDPLSNMSLVLERLLWNGIFPFYEKKIIKKNEENSYGSSEKTPWLLGSAVTNIQAGKASIERKQAPW